MGFINYFINNSNLRLYYGFISGFLLCYSMYGLSIFHIFIDSLITYFFITYYGRKKSAFIILILTIFHLSYIHIYRMIVDYGGWKMDVSGIYMMTIVKFSSMAFSYEDGGKEDSSLRGYLKEM